MSNANRATYSPYGAWELKASYQKNLLMAIAVTVGIVVLSTTGVLMIDSGSVAKPLPLEPDPITTIIELSYGPLPTIVMEQPPVAGGKELREEFTRGIPAPVADDLFIEEDAMIASRDDMRTVGYDGPVSEGIGDSGPVDGLLGGFGMKATDPPVFVPLEKQPEMIYREDPEYPSLARKAGLEGTVLIKALINRDGLVEMAVVMRTSEIASLDESALRAAYRNRFTPGIQNGQPVAVWVAYRVDFVLN